MAKSAKCTNKLRVDKLKQKNTIQNGVFCFNYFVWYYVSNMIEENKDVSMKTKKEEKREADRAKAQKRMIKQAILWGVTLFVIIGATAGIVWSVKNGSTSNVTIGSIPEVTASDWVRGNENSTVVIVEYSDFQCPACAAYYEVVKKLMDEDFGDKVKFVYRHFPLIETHFQAALAVSASESAGLQGKFWQMHDKLFENQITWANNPKAREIFIDYAKELGLNVEEFTKNLDSKEGKEKAINAYKASIKMGLNSTPSFFINGKKIQNPQSYEDFRNIINQSIADNS